MGQNLANLLLLHSLSFLLSTQAQSFGFLRPPSLFLPLRTNLNSESLHSSASVHDAREAMHSVAKSRDRNIFILYVYGLISDYDVVDEYVSVPFAVDEYVPFVVVF